MRLSIVTCTRNPDQHRFKRVLDAIDALRVPPGWDREYLLVDSASDGPLSSRPEVRAFCEGRASGILKTHDRPEPRWLRAAVGVLGLR